MQLFGVQLEIRTIDRLMARPQAKAFTRKLSKRIERVSREALRGLSHWMAKRERVYRNGQSPYEVRSSHDGWMIARKGSSLPIRVFTKKPDAIREAKRLAKEHHTHLDIFTRQGALQMRQSFV